MPHLILTARFLRGIQRCDAFLTGHNPPAAQKARAVVLTKLRLLERSPGIGRPFPSNRAQRELLIRFGKSGYVVLYRHVPEEDAVYLLDFRHQREAGYGS